MKTIIIIPARYASTRFPGKPLTMIGGKTMIQSLILTMKIDYYVAVLSAVSISCSESTLTLCVRFR